MMQSLVRRLSRAIFVCAVAAPLQAQGYRQPPLPIAQILDAPATPLVSVSPDRTTLLLIERPGLPSIAEVSAPFLGMGGDRINAKTNGQSRDPNYTGLVLRTVNGAAERRIQTPVGARIGTPNWAPNGKRFIFTITDHRGIAVWLADVATGSAKPLTTAKVNGTTGTPCTWAAGSERLLCKLIIANRGPLPPEPAVPTGPITQESEGRVAPNRTYEDLLTSPHDETVFEYLYASQLAVVGIDGGVRHVGAPALYDVADVSPDGKWILVRAMHRPFSYRVPLNDFPQRTEVWDAANGTVAKLVYDRPLQDEVAISFDAVSVGPRAIAWRADAPATLFWVEALDGGVPTKPADKRDRVVSLVAPFTGGPVTQVEVSYRARGLQWVRPDVALLTESWRKTRSARTWAFNPGAPGSAPRLVWERSSEDRYGDPGQFALTVLPNGKRVVLTSTDGRYAYLTGLGASAEGDRPFLDRFELATGQSERLWRSASPYFESVVALVDADAKHVITRRESVNDAPNYYVRDLATGQVAALTKFKDPAPQFAGIAPQLITYQRADGVQLSAKMYLPAGYDKTKGALPFLLWAYPLEFKSAAAAAQITGSPYEFKRPTGMSHLFMLLQGYGVLDDPTMPIIGEGDKEPNDTYTEQLVASAQAAVDKIVSMGVADRDRIAVGGHSYGAFMTANLLAHSTMFKAGIARSGAYNRSLTPFGFQGEDRDYWQAQQLYSKMSPFNYADSVKTPILLIHGMADDNSGTFPVQSERFYAALKGKGAKVRYVQLPAEAHGYRARESVGHTLYEMSAWLDRWLKPTVKDKTKAE